MTRSKVKLAFITNEAKRKATYKKRKKGLLKKVSELSTLCGIDCAAIIFGPDNESRPEVWPSPVGVQSVLSRFRQVPQMDQGKKMVDLEGFLCQRIDKASQQLKRQRKDNRETEVTEAMFQALVGELNLQNLTLVDLSDLGWVIGENIKDIERKSEEVKNIGGDGSPPTQELPLPIPTPGVVQHEEPPMEQQPQQEEPLVEQQPQQEEPPMEQQPQQEEAFEVNVVENMQRENWIMDFMSPLPPPPPPAPADAAADQDQTMMGFGGDDVILPFQDNNNNPNANALWSPGGAFL
ncbi:hypothetical protein Tsubulata_048998 [Turnera subulata]|uniref:MADS-box domain-containing protein n=1 Tax=Turnera subulata TaxID=218843 RepID=A0A9Q0FMK5_9ROSI|nr:hypothetical protein Tsubulata_048998 [Turnera subulata]